MAKLASSHLDFACVGFHNERLSCRLQRSSCCKHSFRAHTHWGIAQHFFTIAECEPLAKKIDLELGERIEGLDYALNVLTEKYAALQQENAKLLKQNSRS